MSATTPVSPIGAPARAPVWLIALGNRVFKTRDLLFPLVLVSLIALTEPRNSGRSVEWLGVLVSVAGQLLRVAVVGYRYIVRGGRNREVYADGLVTSGFFAVSRNPLYVGNLLILAGLLIIWNAPVMYLVGVPFFLLCYRAIVAAEEAYLGAKYGAEFDGYCDSVPRWWVRWGVLGEATRGIPFNWRRVILKEYGSAAYWIAGAIVLLMMREQRFFVGITSRLPYLIGLGVVVLLWATARYLKKSKRLRE
jgi:protein-S-isoprenylcysteine O-methyltransferase Ste14